MVLSEAHVYFNTGIRSEDLQLIDHTSIDDHATGTCGIRYGESVRRRYLAAFGLRLGLLGSLVIRANRREWRGVQRHRGSRGRRSFRVWGVGNGLQKLGGLRNKRMRGWLLNILGIDVRSRRSIMLLDGLSLRVRNRRCRSRCLQRLTPSRAVGLYARTSISISSRLRDWFNSRNRGLENSRFSGSRRRFAV